MAQASRRFVWRGLAQTLRSKLFLAPSSAMPTRSFMEGSQLFVGGISFRTTEDGLREAFSAHGEVIDTKIIMDRETGRSRGFGFVTFYKEEDADAALSKLNGHMLDGRSIRVDRASARPPPPRPTGNEGFGGGGGGGFGSSFNDSSDSAGPEDWGSIPSLNVDSDADTNRFSASRGEDSSCFYFWQAMDSMSLLCGSRRSSRNISHRVSLCKRQFSDGCNKFASEVSRLSLLQSQHNGPKVVVCP